MRGALLIVLLFAFVVTAFLPWLVVLGGGNPKELQSEHNRSMMLKASNPVERSINQAFIWLADHRVWLAWASAVGAVLVIV